MKLEADKVEDRNEAAWAYQRAKHGKDEWLTPPNIIKELGPFDLDPCAPVVRPWPTARQHFTIEDNGLIKRWHGRVWMNPPYDRYNIAKWINRAAEHGNAIALVFARTETEFFEIIWKTADAVLFYKGRIRFLHVDGSPGERTGGAGSAFAAWGANNVEALERLQKKHSGFVVHITKNNL